MFFHLVAAIIPWFHLSLFTSELLNAADDPLPVWTLLALTSVCVFRCVLWAVINSHTEIKHLDGDLIGVNVAPGDNNDSNDCHYNSQEH